ncbi:MAG: four helix bundle protein [Chlamydiae bacterium]|nr:four helix bundle protein [Chlamydiota bacterium]MBI3276334.1 four helix bundle protein [Chlamydiota bacterium]
MTLENPKIKKEQFKNEFKQRLKSFILALVGHIDSLPTGRVFQIISDQLIRSGTSIGANYFEARAASSRKDFINFFTHALKSANESKFWLEILMEIDRSNIEKSNILLNELTEISNILASSILTMKDKK